MALWQGSRRGITLVALAVALLALSAAVPLAALADEGHITPQELHKWTKKRADLVSSTFTYVSAISANEEGCSQIKSDGDQREIAAFKRVMKLNAADAQDDSSGWEPLAKWGHKVHQRASSYSDDDDRSRVRRGGDDIDLGASSGQSTLEQVAAVDKELAKLECFPADDNKPHKTFERATNRLGNGFDDLDRVVK